MTTDRGHGIPPAELLVQQVEMTPLDVPEWQSDSEIPYATHQGVLEIGDLSIKVWQLSDGRRVLDADDVNRFFSV